MGTIPFMAGRSIMDYCINRSMYFGGKTVIWELIIAIPLALGLCWSVMYWDYIKDNFKNRYK